MYDRFRLELLTKLMEQTVYSSDDIDNILFYVDQIAEQYEFTQRSTELVTYEENGIPYPVKAYLATKAIQRCQPGTLTLYGRRLKTFFEWVTIPIDKITANDIRMFLYDYKFRNPDKPVGDRTMDKFRSILSNFFKWCVQEKYLAEDPTINVERIKFEIVQRQALEQYELEQIRDVITNLRDRAMIEVFYSTGCRAAELITLKKSDIDWYAKTVHLFGKGRKHRTSYLNAKAELHLKKYLDSRDDDNEYLFVSLRAPHVPISTEAVRKRVKLIASRCPELHKNLHPHIFRHTTATVARKSGMPIENISKLLGHEQITTTQIYTKIDDEDVRADHKKFIV